MGNDKLRRPEHGPSREYTGGMNNHVVSHDGKMISAFDVHSQWMPPPMQGDGTSTYTDFRLHEPRPVASGSGRSLNYRLNVTKEDEPDTVFPDLTLPITLNHDRDNGASQYLWVHLNSPMTIGTRWFYFLKVRCTLQVERYQNGPGTVEIDCWYKLLHSGGGGGGDWDPDTLTWNTQPAFTWFEDTTRYLFASAGDYSPHGGDDPNNCFSDPVTYLPPGFNDGDVVGPDGSADFVTYALPTGGTNTTTQYGWAFKVDRSDLSSDMYDTCVITDIIACVSAYDAAAVPDPLTDPNA